MLFSWLFLHLAGSWINFKGGVVIIKSVKWVPNEVHFVAIQDVGEVKVKDSVLIVWFKTWLWCCSGLADVNKVHNRAFLVHSCLVTSLSFIQIIVAMQKLTHQLCNNQSENSTIFAIDLKPVRKCPWAQKGLQVRQKIWFSRSLWWSVA